jgi:hypothetical protein
VDNFSEIQKKAETLERKAKLKETKLNCGLSPDYINDTEEISSLLVDVIKSKTD